jgi:hypothetical protein
VGNSKYSSSTFKIQKRAIRVMNSISNRTSCKQYFKEMELLPLPCVYILEAVLYVRKHTNMFNRNNSIHEHKTKAQNDIHIERHYTCMIAKNAYYLCCLLYNKLPTYIKNCKTINQFKQETKRLLSVKQFYDINEYLQNTAS